MEVNNVNDNLIDDATTNQTGNKKNSNINFVCLCVFNGGANFYQQVCVCKRLR